MPRKNASKAGEIGFMVGKIGSGTTHSSRSRPWSSGLTEPEADAPPTVTRVCAWNVVHSTQAPTVRWLTDTGKVFFDVLLYL